MWRYWTWHFRGRLDISKVSERPKNGQGEHQSIKQKKLYRECRLALDLVKKVRIRTNINHNTDSNTGFSRFNFSISRLSPENVVLMAPVHRIMITYQFKQDIVQICPYFKNSIVPLNLWTTCYLAPILSTYCCFYFRSHPHCAAKTILPTMPAPSLRTQVRVAARGVAVLSPTPTPCQQENTDIEILKPWCGSGSSNVISVYVADPDPIGTIFFWIWVYTNHGS